MEPIILITKLELQELIKQTLKEVIVEYAGENNLVIQAEYLTVDEVAKLIRISKVTLGVYMKKNMIPYIRKGKRIFFKRSDIESWMEEGKNRYYKLKT